ncbi:MAG: outer membrane lipoprotein-sorting protein [Methylophilaceae bacterium]
MTRFLLLTIGLLSTAATAAVSTDVAPAGKMTAAQIVDRNVAARGGLQAWLAVSTLTLSGRMEAGGTKNSELPFVMKMKRPYKSRLEITFQDQPAVQVYDGEQGWKVRPFLGRNEVEPFTPAEAKAAAGWQKLDGPLVDYVNKGTKVELQGTEAVEGHSAYKLMLTMKNGDQRHVWVDRASFLELKIEGEPRKLDGKLRNVVIYYRDYKAEHGLTVPHLLETVVEWGKQPNKPHKMYIEHVTVNQPLEDALFAKPQLAVAKVSSQQAE